MPQTQNLTAPQGTIAAPGMDWKCHGRDGTMWTRAGQQQGFERERGDGAVCGRCCERRPYQGCERLATDHHRVRRPRGQALSGAGFAFHPSCCLEDGGCMAAGRGQPQPCPVLVPSHDPQPNTAWPLPHPLPPRAGGWFVPRMIQGTFSSSFFHREFWGQGVLLAAKSRECWSMRRMCEARTLGSVSLVRALPSPGIPSPLRDPGCWHLTGTQEWEVSEHAGELGKTQQSNQPRRKC